MRFIFASEKLHRSELVVGVTELITEVCESGVCLLAFPPLVEPGKETLPAPEGTGAVAARQIAAGKLPVPGGREIAERVQLAAALDVLFGKPGLGVAQRDRPGQRGS